MASRIGEMLVKIGLISEAQLNEALQQQKVRGQKLGEILIELGYITTRELVCMLSEQIAIPFVELKPEMLDSSLIQKFPERLLYQLCVLPLYETENNIFMAVGDPTNLAGLDKLSRFTPKQIVVSGADPKKILLLLDQIFLSQTTESVLEKIIDAGETVIELNDQAAVIQHTTRDGRQILQKVSASIFIKLHEQKDKVSHESS